MYKVFVIRFTDGSYHHGGRYPFGTTLEHSKQYSKIGQARGVLTRLIDNLKPIPLYHSYRKLLDGASIEEVTLTPTFSTVQYIELD
jgi:hypothetical protein